MSPFDAMPQVSNTKSLAQHNLHLMPWDGLYRTAILLGLAVTLYVSFRWALFQPLLHTAAEHRWTRFIVHPSILWMLMGVLMLLRSEEHTSELQSPLNL